MDLLNCAIYWRHATRFALFNGACNNYYTIYLLNATKKKKKKSEILFTPVEGHSRVQFSTVIRKRGARVFMQIPHIYNGEQLLIMT